MKTITKAVFSALLLLSAISCKKENAVKTPYSDASSNDAKKTFVIGQHHGGGIIFYLDSTKRHGLIAAPTDQVDAAWYNKKFIDVMNTSGGIGIGYYNTIKIIAAQGTGTYAASICSNYTDGVHHDWYLPAPGELDILYDQRAIVGGFNTSFSSFYWYSQQRDLFNADEKSFYNGVSTYNTKSAICHVRAIRRF